MMIIISWYLGLVEMGLWWIMDLFTDWRIAVREWSKWLVKRIHHIMCIYFIYNVYIHRLTHLKYSSVYKERERVMIFVWGKHWDLTPKCQWPVYNIPNGRMRVCGIWLQYFSDLLTIGIMLNIDQRELFAEMLYKSKNLAHNRFPADFEPPNATGFSLWD